MITYRRITRIIARLQGHSMGKFYQKRNNQDEYEDRIFSKKKKMKEDLLDDDDWDEDRIDIIGSNGNIGYELEDI